MGLRPGLSRRGEGTFQQRACRLPSAPGAPFEALKQREMTVIGGLEEATRASIGGPAMSGNRITALASMFAGGPLVAAVSSSCLRRIPCTQAQGVRLAG